MAIADTLAMSVPISHCRYDIKEHEKHEEEPVYIYIFFYKSVQLFQRPSIFNSSYLRQRCKHYCSSNVNMLIDVDEIFIESQCDNKLHAVNESINRCASVGTHKRLIYYSIAVPSFQLYGIQVQLYENRCYVHGQRVQPSCSGLAF